MAETKSFVVEGDMSLAYYACEENSRGVLLENSVGNGPAVASAGMSTEHLETRIAQELGFPNDAEFDTILTEMSSLREKGLRSAEGTPDGIRTVKLRITVEVLD